MADFDPISPLIPTWPARRPDDATRRRRRPQQPEPEHGPPGEQRPDYAEPGHVDEYA